MNNTPNNNIKKEKTRNKSLFNISNTSNNTKTKIKNYYDRLFDYKDIVEEKIMLKISKIFEGSIYKVNVKLCQNLTSCCECDNGSEGINQDSYIQMLNINGHKKFDLFGVIDEHGINGHLISKYSSCYISESFVSGKMQKKIKKMKNEEDIYSNLIKNKYELIRNLFADFQNAIIKNSKINCEYSGVTCLLI